MHAINRNRPFEKLQNRSKQERFVRSLKEASELPADAVRTLKHQTDRSTQAVRKLLACTIQAPIEQSVQRLSTQHEPMYYDEEWSAKTTLRDDQSVYLRLLSDRDQEFLQRGFQKLSGESRYQRFMTTFNELPKEYLDYLTDVDNDNHLAIAALRRDEVGRETEGVGVARYFRDDDDSDRAEFAVTIIDELHGTGLASILFVTCAAAAWERGIRTFHAEVLPRNQSMQGLASRFGGQKTVSDSELETWEIPLGHI